MPIERNKTGILVRVGLRSLLGHGGGESSSTFVTRCQIWIFTKDSYLSVVEDFNSRTEPRRLLVRARFANDIQKLFPSADASEIGGDYRYRASIPREEVARVISEQISNIKYSNFKNEVRENWRERVYLDVWWVSRRAQETSDERLSVDRSVASQIQAP
jgi:hypothetical protein